MSREFICDDCINRQHIEQSGKVVHKSCVIKDSNCEEKECKDHKSTLDYVVEVVGDEFDYTIQGDGPDKSHVLHAKIEGEYYKITSKELASHEIHHTSMYQLWEDGVIEKREAQ